MWQGTPHPHRRPGCAVVGRVDLLPHRRRQLVAVLLVRAAANVGAEAVGPEGAGGEGGWCAGLAVVAIRAPLAMEGALTARAGQRVA